jgi:hypothetical protein
MEKRLVGAFLFSAFSERHVIQAFDDGNCDAALLPARILYYILFTGEIAVISILLSGSREGLR